MSAVGNPLPVLQTKLYRPRITQDHVDRSRLNGRLKQIERHPLTLVSAPAGYGKSVLLSAWLEQCAGHGAWLSLDINDNDLSSFVSYFLAALRSAIPAFGDDLSDLLVSASLPPVQTFVEMLFAELSRLDEDIILMIDDYGVITDDAVHEFIIELMRHPHPSLHLVMSTRHDPPLPLNEWRARNQLVEIRNIELRFSLAESKSFLQRTVDTHLDEETITALHAKTEGWAAGLRLAALSFSRVEDFRDQIDRLSGSNMYIRDYLVSQVLIHLPAEKQLFLLQTSILDRLCASLCQAVIMLDSPLVDTQATLLELETANVFTIPLDDSRQWFRYHHLFDEFLQTRLHESYSSAVVVALHSRASAWFAAHGFIEEALQHALAAGDSEAAVQLVAANRHELINQESYQRLSSWLQMFPQQIIDGSPDLLLIQARFAQTARFDIAELHQLVGKVDVLIEHLDLEPERAQLLLAENDALRAVVLFYTAPDPQAALTYCRNALQRLPKNWYVMRSYCWMFGAVALQMMGDRSGAYEWIRRGRREDLTAKDEPLARNASAEGFVCAVAADLTGLQHIGEFILGVTTKSGYWETQGWANHFLASVQYHRNDLESAQRHAQQTFDHRYHHPSANVDSAFILILIEQARGRPQEARKMLKTALDYAVKLRSPTFTYTVQSFEAELAVMQGRAHEHILWAEQAYANLFLAPVVSFYQPPITIPKVLLAAGTMDARTMAADVLQRLHAYAETMHHTRLMIEVLALEALLHAANDDEEAAFAALEESLTLAQPGGFVRLYVDLGPEMASLLRRMPNREPYAAVRASILSVFADTEAPDPQSNGQLIEPLTDREAEILELLVRRYSNKEIAAELVIAPATVKRHTINIYQKLAVHSRRAAVEAAVTLGLIPPP